MSGMTVPTSTLTPSDLEGLKEYLKVRSVVFFFATGW